MVVIVGIVVIEAEGVASNKAGPSDNVGVGRGVSRFLGVGSSHGFCRKGAAPGNCTHA